MFFRSVWESVHPKTSHMHLACLTKGAGPVSLCVMALPVASVLAHGAMGQWSLGFLFQLGDCGDIFKCFFNCKIQNIIVPTSLVDAIIK